MGGLNQIGHIIFGAALSVLFGAFVAAGFVVIWEVLQYYKFNSRKSDTIADLVFWCVGISLAGFVYLPVVAITLGGVWMLILWKRN